MLAPETDRPASADEATDHEAQFESDLIGLLPFLRGFSMKVVRNRAMAEDMAQEALTNAWKARASYRSGSNLKAWLCTILRNEYSTHLRRAWRQVPWDPDAAATIPAPHGEQRWASELTDIQRALLRVRNEQREALILVTVAGCSYEEAAHIAKIPVGTLKSRVSRGRASLQKIFDQNVVLPKRKPSPDGGALQEFVAQVAGLLPTLLATTDTRALGALEPV